MHCWLLFALCTWLIKDPVIYLVFGSLKSHHKRATIPASLSKIAASHVFCEHQEEPFRNREMEVLYICSAWFICFNSATFGRNSSTSYCLKSFWEAAASNGIYGQISAQGNSSWSRAITEMEWMSSLCGHPLYQQALCYIHTPSVSSFSLSLLQYHIITSCTSANSSDVQRESRL